MKNLIMAIIYLISSMGNNVYAEDATHLNAKDPAPYEGILLSIPKATDTRTKLIERDQLDSINQSLNKSIDIYKANETVYEQKVDLLMKQNSTLSQSAYDLQSNNFWKSSLMFLAGAFVTGFLVFGVKKAAQ